MNAAGPWIKCSERLPEIDEYVLWYQASQGNYFIECLDKDGNPWLETDDTITYWAEINEPEAEEKA